eukprot:209260_1
MPQKCEVFVTLTVNPNMGCGGSAIAITTEDIKSDILLREDDKAFLVQILTETLQTTKFGINRLYNGREHGFDASTFHSKCDHQGRTIIICESQTGNIFGAYTSIPWSMDNQYHKDPTAFLFIIKNQHKDRKVVPLKTSTEASAHAVQHVSNKGPTFGKAVHALSICTKANVTPTSYTNNGSSYKFDGNEICGGNEVSDGEYYFQLKNYEVHQIV